MADPDKASIEAAIVRIVELMLTERGPLTPLGVDNSLREHGLTSLDMVKLVLLVEAEFDFMIAEDDMIPSNFRSIATIALIVARSLGDS